MGELSQVTNVSVLAAVAVGLVYFLILLAPKIRVLFSRSNGKPDNPQDSSKQRTLYPDMCVPCRQTVHDTHHEIRELRQESQHRDENLCVIVGEMRDALLKYLGQEEILRQTGHGMRVPPASRGGGGSPT
jgi:hypothetical protein